MNSVNNNENGLTWVRNSFADLSPKQKAAVIGGVTLGMFIGASAFNDIVIKDVGIYPVALTCEGQKAVEVKPGQYVDEIAKEQLESVGLPASKLPDLTNAIYYTNSSLVFTSDSSSRFAIADGQKQITVPTSCKP
jgi:hypothetical protein